MTGQKELSEELNKTLIFICKLLNSNNIDTWFITFGTLLGIIRENKCIEGDDDIDIYIDKKYYSKIKKILLDNDFTLLIDRPVNNNNNNRYNNGILKTRRKKYCSIDFYLCDVNDKGDFFDNWERARFLNCFKLIKYEWNNIILNLPNNYEQKLIGVYGEEWKIPINRKEFKGGLEVILP